MAEPLARDLVAAADFLAARRLFGLVWANERMIAEQRLGALVDFVPLGVSIAESVLPLLGLDDQLRALRRRPSQTVAIPNVLLDPADRRGARINLVVHWMKQERRYLLVVSRAPSASELEVTLTAQVRARAIAEADATAKARIIARTNEELARANQDLQAFASVISHDLRSPLRRLRYFAGDAARALEGAKAPGAAHSLELVQQQARRMSSMLTGLLEYSRIGRKSEAAGPVDTARLVAEIIGSVERPAGLEIVVEGAWPTLTTVAQPLDIVLRNLIDNAVKHHDLETGSIIVHGEDREVTWIFSVVDDGPGIPPGWHEAIFEPFKRIQGEEEGPEGSGIGLALVKKTVEWFGGRIEVRSDPQAARGTTFRVHWPKSITA